MRSWQSQRIDSLIELALAMRRRHRQPVHDVVCLPSLGGLRTTCAVPTANLGP